MLLDSLWKAKKDKSKDNVDYVLIKKFDFFGHDHREPIREEEQNLYKF